MIILDTHVLIWWCSDDKKLSLTARSRIEKALETNEQILISAISAWEISMLSIKQRITLSMDVETWLSTVEQIDNLRFVPIDNKVALESTRLPENFHKDPADRMIVALTRTLSATLITADEKILNYPHVKTLY